MRHICWRDQPCGFGLFLDLSYEQKGNYLTRLFIMLVHTTEEAGKKKKNSIVEAMALKVRMWLLYVQMEAEEQNRWVD